MSLRWYLYPAPVVLTVSGRDARRYLNSRLSNDLRSAPAGSAVLAAALTPQGRVEALFTVHVESDERFHLVCDGGNRQAIFAALGRYIVADRVSIVDRSSEALLIHLAGCDLWNKSILAADTELQTQRSRLDAQGVDLLLFSQNLAAVKSAVISEWGEPLTQESYDLARFKRGVVQYPVEVNEDTILIEAGLREAVSFKKGCYVGQEVLERSDALGKLPRRVTRLVFEGLIEPGASGSVVLKDGKSVGKLVSIFNDKERSESGAFALLRSGVCQSGDVVNCNNLIGRVLE